MVSLDPNTPGPQRTLKKKAAAMAKAAMIMSGFDPQPESPPRPRFELGRAYATAAVTKWAECQELDLSELMWRHHCGDWGDLDAEDKQANEDALEHGSRIFSCYLIADRKIYAIIEADRASTTLLFSEEY